MSALVAKVSWSSTRVGRGLRAGVVYLSCNFFFGPCLSCLLLLYHMNDKVFPGFKKILFPLQNLISDVAERQEAVISLW